MVGLQSSKKWTLTIKCPVATPVITVHVLLSSGARPVSRPPSTFSATSTRLLGSLMNSGPGLSNAFAVHQERRPILLEKKPSASDGSAPTSSGRVKKRSPKKSRSNKSRSTPAKRVQKPKTKSKKVKKSSDSTSVRKREFKVGKAIF